MSIQKEALVEVQKLFKKIAENYTALSYADYDFTVVKALVDDALSAVEAPAVPVVAEVPAAQPDTDFETTVKAALAQITAEIAELKAGA